MHSVSLTEFSMGQSIQEWTKQNLWKTAFKKFEVISLPRILLGLFLNTLPHMSIIAQKEYSLPLHFTAFNITMFCCFWHIMTNRIYAAVRILLCLLSLQSDCSKFLARIFDLRLFLNFYKRLSIFLQENSHHIHY